jgi:hypothetical protein
MVFATCWGHSAVADNTPKLVKWTALSTSAMAITGDIKLGPNSLVLGKRSFSLAFVRDLNDHENALSAKLLTISHPIAGRLYAVHIPGDVTLRERNTLCGKSTVTRLIIVETNDDYGPDQTLKLIVLQGDEELYFDGWEKTLGFLCGTYSYFKE